MKQKLLLLLLMFCCTFFVQQSAAGATRFNTVLPGFIANTHGYDDMKGVEDAKSDGVSLSKYSVPNASIVYSEIYTNAATAIGTTQATLGGSLQYSDDLSVTVGIVWSTTNQNPQIGNGTVVTYGNLTMYNIFNVNVSGLPSGTLIYYRAYAIDNFDTNYGVVNTFTTVSLPLDVQITGTNLTCNGGADATASVTVSGGKTPYTYSWTSGETTSSITGKTVGLYGCTVTDGDGTQITRSFPVMEPAPSITVTNTSKVNATCYGGSNGTANVTASGTGLTYVWSPSGGTASSASGLAAGTYTCTITDANGCQTTATVLVGENSLITADISATNACFGVNNGTATVSNATGGLGVNKTYSWSPSGGTGATATGLAPGTYTCTIRDIAMCFIEKTVVVGQNPAMTGSASGTNVSCNGGSNGTATANVTGGTGAKTYVWAPSGQTTQTAMGLPVGIHTCTVTDANGCKLDVSTTIYQYTALSGSISKTDVSCNGGGNGTATAVITGGAGGYTYSWSQSGTFIPSPSNLTTQTITSLVAGTYTCRITDANSCYIDRTTTINQPAASLGGTISKTDVSCNGGNNGTATVSITGGTTPYSYSWGPSGGTNATATGLGMGTYTCTITDFYGCQITRTTTVNQPAAALGGTITKTDVSCNGGNNGSVTVNITGGTTPYSYSWGPSGGTNATATSLGMGTYTCTITDFNGCQITRTTTVNQPAAALGGTISKTDVSCNGGYNGTATVSITGGTTPYSYSWGPSGGTNATATGLGMGTYTCTITDFNGCQITRTTTLNQPAAELGGSISKTDVSCFNGTNGTATVSITGGTTPYSYSWSPSGGTNATATGLYAATYTCTITDLNGCDITRTVTVGEPSAITATSTQNDVKCFGTATGEASVTASGGAGGYTYSWSPSGGTAATATGLTAGTYTCTITDANSCTFGKDIVVGNVATAQLAILSAAQTNIACHGNSTGVATINPATGGQPPYTYSWAPAGGTDTTATQLTAGTYTVTVTDDLGCTASQSFTITEPAASLSANITKIDVSCNTGANGTATVNNIAGGTPGYSYSWSPYGGNNASATGLTAGDYTCTITDINGCTLQKTITVGQPAELSADITKTDVSCNGGANGFATVNNITGGTTPYSYSWSPVGGNNATASGLGTGTYICTITDANSCQISRSITIGQPAELSADITKTDVSCFGGNNGTATVFDITGGNGNYTYSWFPSGGTSATATGLYAGTYRCTITDVIGCFIQKTITVGQPATALGGTISKTDVACTGGNNGTATVSITGGTTPYSYSWGPSGGTNATATGLVMGTYTCTITDFNGCQITRTTTVNQPATALGGSISKTNISCNGGNNGVASVTITGGTTPYSYSWSPSGGTSATASGLYAGTYTCTITDFNGCEITRTETVDEPSAITATSTQNDVKCFGTATGEASVTASGGTGAYTYSWSPSGGTAATATGLTAGTYTCTITDANSCTFGKDIVIGNVATAQLAILSAAQTNIACYGNSTGVATINPATGGQPPYTYSWAPAGGTGTTATQLTAGTYTVTVTDNLGCTASQSFTITEPAVLSADIIKTDVSCNTGANGTATVNNIAGGTPGYSYSWSPYGGNNATAMGLAAGTFTCTITDANGCTLEKTITVGEPAMLSADISKTDVSCNGGTNGSVTVNNITGGTTPYSYSWSPVGSNNTTVTGLAAGVYTCTITDGNSCQITRSITIEQPDLLTADITKTDVLCNNSATGTATVFDITGGNGNYTYLWAPSGGTAATATGLYAGTYTCTITDVVGCLIQKTITVGQPAALTAGTMKVDVACYGTATGMAGVMPSGGTGIYTYSWSPSGGTTNTASNLLPGTYTCTITDANSCTLDKVFTIINYVSSELTITPLSKVDVSCHGGTNGSASISPATGGEAPYTYSWSPSGGTGTTATGLAGGTYTVTVTDGLGCTKSETFVIEDPAPITVTKSQDQVSCFGEADGSATVTVSGGTGAYTYSWSPYGGTAATAIGLVPGTYTCTITDANGCFKDEIFMISEPAQIIASTEKTDVSCFGGANGTATAIASGGTGTFSYSWAPSGGTNATAMGLEAGTYTCTVTDDANGCSVTVTATVGMPTELVATATKTNVSCNEGANGTASVVATGGTVGYTYSWSPAVGNTATVNGLSAGTYTCTITDANSCTATATVTVEQPLAITITPSHTDVSCTGGTDGTATVTASGGTGAYTYSWSPTGGNSATATGLAPGMYTCTIQDDNSCSVTETIEISEPIILSATVIKEDITCNGAADGTATVEATGGNGGYTYSWIPIGGTDATATGLAPGFYTVIITDAKGCQALASVTINNPALLTASTFKSDALCNGSDTGWAEAIADGGTAPYTYSWSPSGGSDVRATDLAAGTYTVTVTDAKGCTATATADVNEPTAITGTIAKQDVFCSDAATGTATVTVTGGIGFYTYSWAPSGGTAATATGLTAGTYTVTVTDANLCTATFTTTIEAPVAIVAIATSTGVSCNGDTNGTATVVATEGVGAYTYSWAPTGGTAATATGLAAGIYTVTVTDANGCTATATTTVEEPAILTATTTKEDVACNGETNGSATAVAVGGTSPYTYSWTNGGGTAVTASDLALGTYEVTITDANGCTTTATAVIEQPAVALSATTVKVDVVCNGAANGSATVTAVGGTIPYTYSWSDDAGINATATDLAAGTYEVIVTDANGCTTTATVEIEQPSVVFSATATRENVSCNGESDGSATVTVTGGIGELTYSWTNGGGTEATATDLAAGTYEVIVTDENGCTATATIVVEEPNVLSATTTKEDVACNGETNGSASAVVVGGTSPYTYSWSDDAGSAVTATNLAPGTYEVTVTDANGCTTTATAVIEQPAVALSATTIKVDVVCNGADNGSATVTALGGTGDYTYSWSPSGGTEATATELEAGTYEVTVTDENGCTTIATAVIEQPSVAFSATATRENVSCNGESDGSATVTVTGGIGELSYAWTNGGGTEATATDLAAGTYEVTVTDENGCTATATVVVEEPNVLSATTTKEDVACNGESNGSATAAVLGGTSPYTYSWSNGGGTAATATGLATGTYEVTVTDANGCTTTATAVIEQPAVALSATAIKVDVVCNGASTGSATVTAVGGTSPYTYSWSNGAGNAATATELTAGTYEVTVTDANGCTTTATAVIAQPATALSATTTKEDVSCNDGNNGFATVTAAGGETPYTYSWSNGGGTNATATGLTAGDYTVTITDANGCVVTKDVTIAEPLAIVITADPENVDAVVDGTATFNVTATNADSYQWQVSSNGTDWANITDGGTEPTYSGATTSTLSITNVPATLDSNEYRVLLTNGTDCVTPSTSALLTVNNSIVAVNDDYSGVVINEGVGGAAGDVTANDLLNNVAVNDTDVIISVVDNDGLFGVTIDETGNLMVPATATLGTYTVTYSICENANPTNCSTAEAIVVVAPPLGVDSFKAFTVSVYPNPASTEVFVKIPEFSTHSNIKVTIYDMNGRTVRESNVTTEIQMIDISSLESGVYNFNIVSDKGTTTKRIVKNK